MGKKASGACLIAMRVCACAAAAATGACLRAGGIKGKGKKNGGSLGGGHGGGSGGKLKKNSQFKSLKKQQCVALYWLWVETYKLVEFEELTTAVVAVEKKKQGGKKHLSGKKPVHVSEEVRNFNERIAGQKKRSEALKYQATTAKSLSIAPPTFVVAAPTFSFGAPPPVKEVEGFQGFLTTMTAPKDAPQPRADPEARRVKPIQPAYQGSNVFAVLEVDEEEEQQQQQQQRLQQQQLLFQQQQREQQRLAAMAAAVQRPAPFLQPATFAFATAAPTFQFQVQAPTSVTTTPILPSAGDIDPDL